MVRLQFHQYSDHDKVIVCDLIMPYLVDSVPTHFG